MKGIAILAEIDTYHLGPIGLHNQLSRNYSGVTEMTFITPISL